MVNNCNSKMLSQAFKLNTLLTIISKFQLATQLYSMIANLIHQIVNAIIYCWSLIIQFFTVM